MSEPTEQPQNSKPLASEVFLAALSAHGVDFFFGNPGTDFVPVIEAFERAAQSGALVPRPILVPHENLALAMGHGAHLMTGHPQVVMVHVNVGTGNTINNLAIASRERTPIMLAAGRTPITESGHFGSREKQIHWGQEMFDQAGMVRELVKWDYEVRLPDQIGNVVARAFEVATASPQGPIYLMLPREPLSATLDQPAAPVPPRARSGPPHPDPESIATLARWIADSERPLIITSAIGRDPDAVPVLAGFADRYAVPVVSFVPRYLNFPSSHPMHAGHDHTAMLAEADLIVAIECEVPWFPVAHDIATDCRVVHIGEDPAFVWQPMRSFQNDLSIISSSSAALRTLDVALAHSPLDEARITARRARVTETLSTARQRKDGKAVDASGEKITVAYASRCVSDAIGEDAVVFNEYPLSLDHCPREKPGTFFNGGMAGGLGWGLGAALGAKLAAPERLVVAVLGDGCYLFANPTVAHWVGTKYDLPVLAIIFNNSRYGAVRSATMSMFGSGFSGRNGARLFADLNPSPPYEDLIRAHGGFGERVDKPGDLPHVLAAARDAVVNDRRQALVNIITPY